MIEEINNKVFKVLNEELSPYTTLNELKQLKKAISEAIEVVECECFNQSVNESDKFKKDGFEIEKRKGRKVWNFKECKSFKIANDNLEEIKQNLKLNFSQYEKGKTVVDENGEIAEVPKVTYTKESIILKKL